jgi:ABC-type molybdate transport system substrate-binding protein
MGLFNISEATITGVVVAGPVPAPLQEYTGYDAAVLSGAANKAAAAAFLKYATGSPRRRLGRPPTSTPCDAPKCRIRTF